MNAAVKFAAKLISLEFNLGIDFNRLFDEVKKEFSNSMSLNKDTLLESLRNIPELTVTENASGEVTLFADKSMQQYFSQSNVIKYYFSENEAFFSVMEGLYRIIILSKTNGITYQALNEKYNSENNAKLELPMMSHYCKKLEQCHLANIIHKDNKRLVTAILYMKPEPLIPSPKKISRKADDAYYDVLRGLGNTYIMKKTKQSKRELDSNAQESKASIMGDEDMMNEENSQKDYGEDGTDIQLHDASLRKYKNLFDKSSTFRELTFIQNFFVNAAGAEANIKKGLSLREVSQKLIKYGDKKMLARFLKKINDEKTLGLQSISHREGKTFSYKYLIKDIRYQKLKLRNRETVPVATSSNVKISLSTETPLQIKNEEKPADVEESNLVRVNSTSSAPGHEINCDDPIAKDKILQIIEEEQKRQISELLNIDSFNYLLKYFPENEKLLKSLYSYVDKSVFDFFFNKSDVPSDKTPHEAYGFQPG